MFGRTAIVTYGPEFGSEIMVYNFSDNLDDNIDKPRR